MPSHLSHTIEEVMSRLPEVVGRGAWVFVEEYMTYEIEKAMDALVVEKDIDRIKRLQGEILAFRKMLRLKDDVLHFDVSDDTSEPE